MKSIDTVKIKIGKLKIFNIFNKNSRILNAQIKFLKNVLVSVKWKEYFVREFQIFRLYTSWGY